MRWASCKTLLNLQSVPQLETNPCPLCGESEGSPIAERVAGGHTLDTQSCIQCGTVYQSSSWTSDELLIEYEAEQLGDSAVLVLPIPEGTLSCSDPQFERVRNAQLTGRAHNAITLGYMQTGDRVLQLGCGTGETLSIQREVLGVDCFGVEVSTELAALATESRVDTTITTFDSPDFSFEELDVIESFHFLQRVPDPLQWLRRSWECLAVGGRIVIEVPNPIPPARTARRSLLAPRQPSITGANRPLPPCSNAPALPSNAWYRRSPCSLSAAKRATSSVTSPTPRSSCVSLNTHTTGSRRV